MGAKVIHFAGMADREIGTARCGIRLQGNVSTDDAARVTCEKCGAASPALPDPVGTVHFDFGPEFTDCMARLDGETITQNLSAVTCLPCLRHKVRMEIERNNSLACAKAAENKRADTAREKLEGAITYAGRVQRIADERLDDCIKERRRSDELVELVKRMAAQL